MQSLQNRSLAAPVPLTDATYVKATLGAIWDHLPRLIAGGLCFGPLLLAAGTLLSAPWWPLGLVFAVVAAGPAWTGLLWFEAHAFSNASLDLMGLFRFVGRTGWASLSLGLATIMPGAMVVFTLRLVEASGELPFPLLVSILANGLLLLAAIAVFPYAAPIIVFLEAGPAEALLLGLRLAIRHLNHTLGLIGMGVLSLLAMSAINGGLLFILPPIWGAFMVTHFQLVNGEASASTN